MKIVKFTEFINEELLNDTPETYISSVLSKLKRKIDGLFEESNETEEEEAGEKSIKKAKEDSKKNKEKLTFKDLGIRLESSEISKYSKLYDSLTIVFRDDEFMYHLIIMIDLKEALPKDPNKDFTMDDVKMCYIKFKKYSLLTKDIELIGQISKNVEIKKIDEEFIIDLKIELDDEFGDEEEKLEIETE
jgi:hypothetical protein